MATTKYLWDDETDTVVMEKDGTGTTKAVYHTDPVPYGRLFSMRRDNITSNYRYDAQGNTRALTDDTGKTTDTYSYTAFGTPRTTTGTTKNPYRYGGQHGYQYNETTGDYYIRARTYEPTTSRWLSKDPARFIDGLNLYSFLRNSVLNRVDPSGLKLNLRCCKCSNWALAYSYVKWVKADCKSNTSSACCKETCGEQGYTWCFEGETWEMSGITSAEKGKRKKVAPKKVVRPSLGYGHYCGPNQKDRTASCVRQCNEYTNVCRRYIPDFANNPEPISDLDRACEIHDCCLFGLDQWRNCGKFCNDDLTCGMVDKVNCKDEHPNDDLMESYCNVMKESFKKQFCSK